MSDFIDDDIVEMCHNLFEDVRHVHMTNDQYHASSYKSLSKTRLTTFKWDPQEFFQRWVTGEMEDTDTTALIFGRVFHEMVLEKVGSVTSESWNNDSLAVFRPCPPPRRAADIIGNGESIWVVELPEPGIVRTSAEWGDLDNRCWILKPAIKGTSTAFCSCADMHQDGKLFWHIPDSALSDSGKRQGKQWTDWKNDHEGTLYTSKEWYNALSMRRRLRQHGDANRCLFQGGTPEYTLIGKCVETGLEVRTRLDFFKPVDGGTLISDLKTTRDADEHAWNRQADNDGLNMQAAMVIGMASHVFKGAIDFRFVVSDKRAPFTPMTFEIEKENLELGARDYVQCVSDFRHCLDSGTWLCKDFGNPARLVVPAYKQVQWM